ncbi:MAG TPA: hypothetical protein VK524_11715, partial [Polyangiaceae bacterium]|nr:hypothetical protein [Polyangiaceae bacterium]
MVRSGVWILLALAVLWVLFACREKEDWSYGEYDPPKPGRCATDGGTTPILPDSAEEPRLEAAAREELLALGVAKYQRKARVTKKKKQPDGFVRVTFDPASGPVCIVGDEYSAFYFDQKSDKLLIDLGAGGACWSDFCLAIATVPETIAPKRCESLMRDWNWVIVP